VGDGRTDTDETFRSLIFSSYAITVIKHWRQWWVGTLVGVHKILNNILEEKILPGRSSVRFEGAIYVTDLSFLLPCMPGFSS
jgi:hypothetical protein